MKRFLIFPLVILVILSCGKQGPTGPAGSQGQTGPQGPPGVSLIKEYTGTISSDGNYTLDVPEILDKRTTTFVMAYWTFSTSPNLWIPMTDSWLDSIELCHIFYVSWTYGKVGLTGMLADDLYLVQVF